MTVRIINADVMDGLAQLSDESVHCVVTSPPYWGLRDYGVSGQIGLEPTLGEYIDKMVAVFREVRRVLRKDGTLWLNLGDSYAASPNGRSAAKVKELGNDDRTFRDKPFSTIGPIAKLAKWNRQSERNGHNLDGPDDSVSDYRPMWMDGGLKPKDLCGIPWRIAFALQADAWWLRQDIIWSKPNPMPESVKDRCTKAHEYLFLLAKSERYYFDAHAIAEPFTDERLGNPGTYRAGLAACKTPMGIHGNGVTGKGWNVDGALSTRNKRSVWEIATQPFSGAHFATFPPALIEPCIKAGTSERGCCAKCGAPQMREIMATGADGRSAIVRGGKAYDADGRPLMGDNMIDAGVRGSFNSGGATLKRETIGWLPSCKCKAIKSPVCYMASATAQCTVLDPFAGSGTTGMVADRLKRNAILIELNPEYAAIAEKRIKGDCPMFAEVTV